MARIRQYLESLGGAALRAMLLELAERDSATYRKLELASAAASSDDRTLEAGLHKALTAVTAVRGFIAYGEAGAWASEVRDVLDSIVALVPAGHGAVALKLAEYALARIEANVPPHQPAGNSNRQIKYGPGRREQPVGRAPRRLDQMFIPLARREGRAGGCSKGAGSGKTDKYKD